MPKNEFCGDTNSIQRDTRFYKRTQKLFTERERTLEAEAYVFMF